jgi:hypothetical protein
VILVPEIVATKIATPTPRIKSAGTRDDVRDGGEGIVAAGAWLK